MSLTAVGRDALDEAARHVARHALRTPLVPLSLDDDGPELHLKLECLQPIGSFKLRGAANALAQADPAALADGVFTASAGNMAQGVAWVARERGLPCTVLVPDHAPRAKVAAVERLGGRVVRIPFEEWWEVLTTRQHESARGFFVHPVCDPAVVAGNGTVGLEILEQLPEVGRVIVPYGGGGLSCGIASALVSAGHPAPVWAAEVETAAPLAASLAAGRPVGIEYQPSFVDGIGGRSLLEPMWPLVRDLLAGSIVVSLEQIAEAVRLLVSRARVVAEGAGAASVAAGLTGRAGDGPVVCVVSGGNLDPHVLAALLAGQLP